jgi:SAM-dependent methyltransferase
LYAGDAVRCPQCGYAPTTIDGFRAWAPDAARMGEHFDPVFFAKLATYEERNFWFRARNALIVAMLRQHAPGLTSFFEIGCGNGFVLKAVGEAFPHASRMGGELFINALPIAARRNPGAELVQMDARAIPYLGLFDVVSAFDVLEHIVDDDRVIANLFAAAKPGGLFIASVPQHPLLWSASDKIGHHVRRYTRDELKRKVTMAGFTVLRSTSFVSLLLPAMMLSRGRKTSIETLDPMAEFQIPRWLDASLYAVLAAERAVILAGIDLPIGGSRLVVARRPL